MIVIELINAQLRAIELRSKNCTSLVNPNLISVDTIWRLLSVMALQIWYESSPDLNSHLQSPYGDLRLGSCLSWSWTFTFSSDLFWQIELYCKDPFRFTVFISFFWRVEFRQWHANFMTCFSKLSWKLPWTQHGLSWECHDHNMVVMEDTVMETWSS